MALQSQLKKIGILGCGWLGLPLAKSFVDINLVVNGSTTSKDKFSILKESLVEPFLINLSNVQEDICESFFKVDLLVICVAPGKNSNEDSYHLNLSKIIPFVSQSTLVIFISSTSVYHANNKEVREEDVISWPQSASPKIGKAEDLIKRSFNNYLILRCGGLTGYDRMLAKYFAGKTNLLEGNCPINLIHRDDVIAIIHFLVGNNIKNEVINICAPGHPIKCDYYTSLCKRFGMNIPTFLPDDNSPYKVVSVNKLVEKYGYNFIFKDPYMFDY